MTMSMLLSGPAVATQPLFLGFSQGQLLILLTLLCVALFVLGFPILLVFGTWVLGFHFFVPLFSIRNVAIIQYSTLQSFAFTAIPLFIVVGDLVNESGIADELIAFARSIVGWIPGITANTAIVTSGIFSAITGSNAATTASVGKALYPNLVDEGYDEEYAAGTIASGGVLGAIIPPSILLIIYGVTFNVNVPKLFLAGVIPGLGMLFALLAVNTHMTRKHNYGTVEEFSIDIRDVLRSAWRAKVGLGTIVVLLGGIFLGFFTPTESAAVALVYVIVAGAITGKLTEVTQLARSSTTALLLMGIVLPVVVMSVGIQQNLSFLGLQEVVSNSIIGLGNKYLIILAMFIVIMIAGTTMASVPNLLLTAPLLAGAASEIGLSTVMWGIIFMMGDSIGFITPPYGLNLYVMSGIADIDYVKVARGALPHLIALMLVWLLFFVFPQANVLVS